MTAALRTTGLTAGYGDVAVVHDLDLEVHPGEIVALMGANGAGKTTALLTAAGALRPLGGDLEVLGTADPREDLRDRAARGLALLTDDRSVFRSLTTRENLRLGRGPMDLALAAFPELERLLDRPAGLLSGGEQQMLGLGRVLAARPKLLLADELSLGLAPIVVHRLLAAVRELADSGCAVLLVEQQVRLVLDVADRGYVLQRGRVALAGTGDELRRNRADIERSYLSVTVEKD
ncbi:ATP-binding cassette domain-containing protein [Actinoallomurus spadix]|uniref:ABC transporter ATP-binding protein n=1 Tax=Actinoallomurus spadix TaxID=79912 RepID=A0ABN0XJH0_9ACTN|nr:ATP-binding cassette domain-containing protein [Actinoallomurus spadix]MCO5984929.1 ATP-binding cassette domain-containing protein [Actinoallomurus spadix]